MTNATYISSVVSSKQYLPANNKLESETNNNRRHTSISSSSSSSSSGSGSSGSSGSGSSSSSDNTNNKHKDNNSGIQQGTTQQLIHHSHNNQIDKFIKQQSSFATPSATTESARKRWSLLAQAVRYGLTKQNQERCLVKEVIRKKLDKDDSSILFSSAGLCVWTKLDGTNCKNYDPHISSSYDTCSSLLLPPKQLSDQMRTTKENLLSASSSLDTSSSECDDDSEKSTNGSSNSICSSDLDNSSQKNIAQELHQNLASDSSSETYIWFECRCPKIPSLYLRIRHRFKELTFTDLVETFDNTGNVRIWPSEEALAYYAVNNKHLFTGKRICELGAGMAGLASLAIACTTHVEHIYITDGNERCVENIEFCIDENIKNLKISGNVSARQLRWSCMNDYQDLRSKMDLVICSDCLYLDKSRAHLVRTIAHLLSVDGEAIIIAPNRGSSLSQFLDMASFSGFIVTKIYDYIDELFETHKRLMDLNVRDPVRVDNIVDQYPILIRLKKQTSRRLVKSPISRLPLSADN